MTRCVILTTAIITINVNKIKVFIGINCLNKKSLVVSKNNAMYGVFRSHLVAYIRGGSRISGKGVHLYKGVSLC